MSLADEAITSISLKLVLLEKLDPSVLTPLVKQLAAACPAIDLQSEFRQMDVLLRAQPSTVEHYTEFTQILETVRHKIAGVAGSPNNELSSNEKPAAAGSDSPLLSYDTGNSLEIMNHFFLESTAHLEAVEAAALHLEAHPRDEAAMTGAFRAFHSLKGVTGFLDLTAARDLIHQAEALIEVARKRAAGMLSEECDRILRTVDMERTLVELVRVHSTNPTQPFPALPPTYPDLLRELRQSALAVPPTAMQAATIPAKKSGVRRMPAASSAVALALKVQPEASIAAPASAAAPAPVLPSTAVASDALSAVAPTQFPDPLAVSSTATKAVDLRPASNEVTVQPVTGSASKSPDKLGDAPLNRRETDQSSAALVRVQVEKLDRLIDAIGELAITQIQIFQNRRLVAIEDETLNRNVALAGKITRELQTLAMTLRMVPLRETFGRMTRMARDIAHRQGKEVTITVTGEETEMDKSLIESLLDPLTHLVRNAIDHGIALPADREKAGKPGRANLRLAARSQGGYVVVEVSDDGSGLNLPKIQAKARQKGLLREGETADPFQLQQFIFEPGFSTAEQVTELSGRGIGLDVVRNQAAAAGGRVTVSSTAGQSTTFTITLPLTLAIIDGLILLCGGQEFILPLTLVVESLRPTRSQLGTIHERGQTVDLRGHAYPLVRLADYARVRDAKVDPCDAIVIIVDSRGEQYALQVDEILGVQQVVIKNLGDRLNGLKGISGGAILGDGRVRLILDVVGILAQSRSMPWQAAG